jgi:hypothetical protein
MNRFGTDALAIAMIIGGAGVATGATVLLAQGGRDDARTATECEAALDAERVIVAVGVGGETVAVAPRLRSQGADCASPVRVATVRLDHVVTHADQVRDRASSVRDRAERARERADRGREAAERARASADRGREAAERARERADRGREAAARAREHAERSRQRVMVRQQALQERIEAVEESSEGRARVDVDHHVSVDHDFDFDHNFDFDHDFDFDFDHDFDFDFDHDFDFDFDHDFDFDFDFDGTSMRIRLDGLSEMQTGLEDLERSMRSMQLELEGLDPEAEAELERRITEAMQKLEERLSRVRVDGGL